MSAFEDLTSDKLNRMAREVLGRPILEPPAPRPPDVRARRQHEEDGRRLTRDRLASREERAAGVHDRDHMTRWRPVMERFGFRWWGPDALEEAFGPEVVLASDADPDLLAGAGALYLHRSHSSGMWRREADPYQAAFRPDDLIALFDNDPETFVEWIEDQIVRAYASRAGLVLPSRPKRSGKVQIFIPSVIGGAHRR